MVSKAAVTDDSSVMSHSTVVTRSGEEVPKVSEMTDSRRDASKGA